MGASSRHKYGTLLVRRDIRPSRKRISFKLGRHYRRAVGAIIVYDITKESSFKNVGKWIEALQANAGKDIVLMLVGNKLDLVKVSARERKVSFEEGDKLAKKLKILFCEASAYDQTNIKEAFETLLDSM